ncbi:hypothetical protein [uncultured Draconibacterium sp.]|uniref:hypothetical protein n=1 Tax=uncultured Draconibacterium sp. TaxID=1573823 RepID=UPI003217009D
MKKLTFLLLAMLSIVSTSFSQNSTDEFEPNGKPLALIFTNFNTAFSDGETNPAFGITRAYLGYEYNFSKEFYAKVVFDVGDPKVGALKSVAYLKNAYVQYKSGNFKAYFGMISTTQFKASEKIWGYRYVEKSFQDAYKFNSSADFGFNMEYKFNDFVSADFSVINGEGYKVIQSDDFVRPGLGITATPVKNVTARVFADYMGDEVKQQSLATFLAYTGEKVVLGAEYNYQQNMGMEDGHDIYGTSFYGTFKPNNKIKIFGRFDDLKSKKLEGESEAWNIGKDGQLIMAGVEFSPVKGIKVAPNYRLWSTADDSPNTSYLYLNLELKF